MLDVRRKLGSAALLMALAALSSPAHAGGYDTPMLYSARHMGMGGTAVGYVGDPSALFHNPAGLAKVDRGELLGDFSLLLGKVHASPLGLPGAQNIDSALTKAPFFLLGGAYRVERHIVLGLGLYPIASAGATYHYFGREDTTELFFLEASPAVAVNVLPNLRFGAGYRFTYVRLYRFDATPAAKLHDFTLTGENYLGLRVGVQWAPLPWLELGGVFRNKTVTKVKSAQGTALGQVFTNPSTEFTLPAKLGAGTRVDFASLGLPAALAFDLEYAFNAENVGAPLVGTASSTRTEVPNLFKWSNAATLRFGAEYRIELDKGVRPTHVATRVGYVYDQKTANATYPTAFGTPPGPTQVVTAGGGYVTDRWQTNLAYAYRFGTGVVTNPDNAGCPLCGYPGDYAIHLHGIYVDASYKF